MDNFTNVGGIFVVNPETGEPERAQPAVAKVVEPAVIPNETVDDPKAQPKAAARRI